MPATEYTRDLENEVMRLNSKIADLEERLAQFEAKTGFMSAEEIVKHAKAWTVNNPHAWQFMRNYADRAIVNNERFSMQKVLEEMRESPLAIAFPGEDFKINNSYAAAFVRMLVAEKPDLAKHVTLRRSKVDRLIKSGGKR